VEPLTPFSSLAATHRPEGLLQYVAPVSLNRDNMPMARPLPSTEVCGGDHGHDFLFLPGATLENRGANCTSLVYHDHARTLAGVYFVGILRV